MFSSDVILEKMAKMEASVDLILEPRYFMKRNSGNNICIDSAQWVDVMVEDFESNFLCIFLFSG